MSPRYTMTERGYAFLQERNDGLFNVSEMAAATGWSENTIRTYIPKFWRPWVTRFGMGMYRVHGFENVSIKDFKQRQSQVKPGSPDEIRDDTVSTRDEFMSDEEWSNLTRTLRSDASRIAETQNILRRIIDNLDTPIMILRDAEAADVLLDTVAEYIEADRPGDESHARTSAEWLRSFAKKIQKGTQEYAVPLAEIARRLIEVFGA